MNHPLPPRAIARAAPPPRRRLCRASLLLIACTLVAGLPPAAEAGGCDGCPGPTVLDLRADPSFRLPARPGMYGIPVRDTYFLDRGACHASATGLPIVRRLRSWLVLRGAGEVWNCPHSKSEDTITITSQQSDSTEWTLKTKVGVELKAPAASLKAEVEAGKSEGVTITEVTQVSKTISPGYCRRITWTGWFEVGEFEATGEFVFRQRWAWWTKNATTGDKVHAKGDIWIECGTHTLVMDRKAPLSGHFELSQRGCDDPACAGIHERHLGWYPPLPPYLPDPGRPEPGPSDDTVPDDDPEPDENPVPDENPAPDEEPEPDRNPEPDATPDEDPLSEEDRQREEGGDVPLDSNPDDGVSSGELGEAPTGPLPNPLEAR